MMCAYVVPSHLFRALAATAFPGTTVVTTCCFLSTCGVSRPPELGAVSRIFSGHGHVGVIPYALFCRKRPSQRPRMSAVQRLSWAEYALSLELLIVLPFDGRGVIPAFYGGRGPTAGLRTSKRAVLLTGEISAF